MYETIQEDQQEPEAGVASADAGASRPPDPGLPGRARGGVPPREAVHKPARREPDPEDDPTPLGRPRPVLAARGRGAKQYPLQRLSLAMQRRLRALEAQPGHLSNLQGGHPRSFQVE